MGEGLDGEVKPRGLRGAATGVQEPTKNRRNRGCRAGRVMWGDWGLGNGAKEGGEEMRDWRVFYLEQVQRAGQGQANQKQL